MLLNLYHDQPLSGPNASIFEKEEVLERLQALDVEARRKGLQTLDPKSDKLVRIGMEVDESGEVTKNSYGVFNLAWRAQEDGNWPERVDSEAAELRKAIKKMHGTSLRSLIWAGMGGSAEDKAMYNAAGLLRKGPRLYILDSTDPAKLAAILEDIAKRCGGSLADGLKSTLVVGMALGMTSYEPVVNLQKIAALYAKHGIDSAANIVYMTLPDSLLDRFGQAGGYRRIPLQLDNGNGTSGRHSAPLTRGSLYPLALARQPLAEWINGTVLTRDEIASAWKLSAFLHGQAKAGRGKITLLLPKVWAGAAIWTKQNFEESLGKSEAFGLKIVVNEKVKLANYRGPKDAAQDRCFLALQFKGSASSEAAKVASIRRAGYPTAVLTMKKQELSRYMQWIHYVVFGIGYLEDMNFVTQPSVELYKKITNRLHAEAEKAGGLERTAEWERMQHSPQRFQWRDTLTLHCEAMNGAVERTGAEAPEVYASLLRKLVSANKAEYGELTFFGDTRYSTSGKALQKCLERAGERVFRGTMKIPLDVYEGPAMNHSYHEMVIGHGRCFSTVLLSEQSTEIPEANYTAEYHRAQFLATQLALEERGRAVVALTLKSLEPASLAVLDEFFESVAKSLKARATR